MRRALATLALVVLAASCTRPGPVEGRRGCVSWKGEVQAEVQAKCTRCHSGAAAAAGYDMNSYNGVLGSGTDDRANAIAGDGSSVLLLRVRPNSTTDAVHAELTDIHALLQEWVVECELAYAGSGVHPAGFANPVDPEFHGTQLRANSWDTQSCQRCHGADYTGGPSGQSCLECHEQGVTSCSTCHAAVPTSGVHTPHLQAPTTQKPLVCRDCHQVPLDWRDPGHVFLADGTRDPPPVELTFGERARQDVHPENRQGPPTFSNGGCSNIACHGDGLGDTSASREFRWVDNPVGQVSCTRCHGSPPSSHQHNRACIDCHAQVVVSNNNIANYDKHLNGMVEVGPEGGDCTSCHGGVPFADTTGATDPTVITVGAHDAHLHPRTAMSRPMACADCHVMPARNGSPGHMDTDRPAEVFNWDSRDPGLGGTRGANPIFERSSASCSATYCHGGGAVLATDTSPTVRRLVPWNSPGSFRVVCGSCHGVPPTTAPHDATMNSLGCVQCHPGTVDQHGAVIVQPNGTSLHLNGIVDATE